MCGSGARRTDRPTQDLDFFRSSPDVVTARDAFGAAAVDCGWRVAGLRDHNDFVRLLDASCASHIARLSAPTSRVPASKVRNFGRRSDSSNV